LQIFLISDCGLLQEIHLFVMIFCRSKHIPRFRVISDKNYEISANESAGKAKPEKEAKDKREQKRREASKK